MWPQHTTQRNKVSASFWPCHEVFKNRSKILCISLFCGWRMFIIFCCLLKMCGGQYGGMWPLFYPNIRNLTSHPLTETHCHSPTPQWTVNIQYQGQFFVWILISVSCKAKYMSRILDQLVTYPVSSSLHDLSLDIYFHIHTFRGREIFAVRSILHNSLPSQ